MIEALLQADRVLMLGMLDEAERLYRQVADGDPRNAIAVVGLARVAVERGDHGTAYRHARRALTIDPENVAAFRLAARLEEVLAHRGEPLPTVDGPATVAELMPSRGPAAPPPVPVDRSAPGRPGPTAARRPEPVPSPPDQGSTGPTRTAAPRPSSGLLGRLTRRIRR